MADPAPATGGAGLFLRAVYDPGFALHPACTPCLQRPRTSTRPRCGRSNGRPPWRGKGGRAAASRLTGPVQNGDGRTDPGAVYSTNVGRRVAAAVPGLMLMVPVPVFASPPIF